MRMIRLQGFQDLLTQITIKVLVMVLVVQGGGTEQRVVWVVLAVRRVLEARRSRDATH